MQCKTAFFASPSSDLRHFSLDNFDNIFRRIVLRAHAKKSDSVADAKFYLAIHGLDLDTTIQILLSIENTGLLNGPISDAIFSPAGCGDTANALCKMMTGNEMISKSKDMVQLTEKLTEALEDNLPKIMRIDIPGHSYVILACENSTEGILGYVYQSNVAYGMEDNSFSFAAWLMDIKSHKTNITQHIQKLNQLLNPLATYREKKAIYRELFFANPIIPVKIAANLQEIIPYINENLFLKYEIKKLNVKHMFQTLENMMGIYNMSFKEQQQSLNDYILKIREEIVTEPEQSPDSNSTLT